MNQIESIFKNNKKNLIHKWSNYFEIYERYFGKYVDKEVKVLEIGIFQGGSLEMWKEYFGPRAFIYGVDINPDCKVFEQDQVEIFIGSQDDREFWRTVKKKIPKVDILIDDGGHMMSQQIITFEEMFDHVKDDGIYLCEDTHTSYWPHFRGGLRNPDSFVEYAKDLIDSLTGWHYYRVDKYTKSIKSINFFSSVVVFEKALVSQPEDLMTGTSRNIENLVQVDKITWPRIYLLKTIIKRLRKALQYRH